MGLGTRRTGLGTRRTGSENEVRNKPVKEVAQTITVPGCSMRSGIIFVKLRGTRILTKGDSRFYIQPEVGRWMASSKYANGSFRMCQYGSFQCTNIAPSECTNIAPSECMLTIT
jgi:hypothetical protein